MERWREYFQKLMVEENPRERKKFTASRSGGRHYRDYNCRDKNVLRKMWESYNGPDKLLVAVWTSVGRTGLDFHPQAMSKIIDEEKSQTYDDKAS